jgi:hypothetical protein
MPRKLETASPVVLAQRPAFSSVMSTKVQPLKLDGVARRMFNIHEDKAPQAISFTHWSPDPWHVTSPTGAALCTLSGMNLTIVKAQSTTGQLLITYNLAVNVKSDGWTANNYYAPIRLDFMSAQGGIVYSFHGGFAGPNGVMVRCGEDSAQLLSDNFDRDVFSSIAGAHLSMPEARFWQCP